MEDKIKVELEVDTSKAESSLENLNSLSDRLKSKFDKKLKLNMDVANIQKLTVAINKVDELRERMIDAFMAGDISQISELEEQLKTSVEEATKLGLSLGLTVDELREALGIEEETDKKTSKIKENVKETTKHAGFLHKIFARIGQSISKQIFTSIASLLNPLNNLRKTFTYLTDVVSPRLGATFKNIGENILQYFATSPLFENLIHGAIKLIYLLQQIFNIFARIFGFRQIDLFATSIKTGKKLQKMQQQMVAGFDEINDIGGGNQQDQLDATPLGIGELLSEEERKKLDDFANKFTDVAETIKKAWDWVVKKFKEVKQVLIDTGWLEKVKQNWWKFALAIAGIILIFKLLSGVSTDLSGLILVCVGLAAVFLTLSSLVSELNSGTTTMNEIITLLLTVFISISVLMAGVALLGPSMAAGLGPFLAVVGSIVVVLGVMALTLPIILDALGTFIDKIGPTLIGILDTIFKGIDKIVDTLGKSLLNIIKEVGNIWEKIFNGIAKVVLSVGTVIVNIMTTAGNLVDKVLKAILNFIRELGPAINTFVDNAIKAVTKLINFLISGIEYMINTLIISAINKMIGSLNDILPDKFDLGKVAKVNIPRFIPKLATGTGYVPNDQLAYIHQGEAVIPKKFNDREYFGGGNEETNYLLETLIDKIDNIDFNPYTTVKDVGRAAVEYMKETSRQTGRSVI